MNPHKTGKLRVLDLFSGIGGFSLGLERTGGFETVAFCEIEPYPRAVLKKHWPKVPCYEDVRTLTAAPGSADIVCGGFPCQDISKAGKRAGTTGARSGLFRELVRTVRMVRPKYAIMENVADLVHRGMGDVCGELAESRLHAEWDCVSAADVGAPHYRDVRQQSLWPVSSDGRRRKGKGKGKGAWHSANADSQGELQPGWCFSYVWRRPVHSRAPSLGWGQHWRDCLGSLCRMDDGVSRRLDEAKPVGNAVCTAIPELIGRAILETERASQ
jgi:DNA (cytosine-5)-methyltransferase 1